MLYIDTNGNKIEITETLLEKPDLKQKLENLLAR